MDPQINIGGDFGKPANTLIEKISNAIEGAVKPQQIVRLAKAQREADLIEAHTKIEIAEEQIRAMKRWAAEETIKQQNMGSIVQKAIPLLEEGGSPNEINDDWIVNFFNKSRHISDEEMQTIWARILAGEANSPGSFSRRTINFLDNLDKRDALYFTKFCSFCWDSEGPVPLIYDESAKIYTDNGLTFSTLNHLNTIGLINYTSIGQYLLNHSQPVNYKFSYNKTIVVVSPQRDPSEKELFTFSKGKADFTGTGRELAKIVTGKPVDGFLDYTVKKWKEKNYIVNMINDF